MTNDVIVYVLEPLERYCFFITVTVILLMVIMEDTRWIAEEDKGRFHPFSPTQDYRRTTLVWINSVTLCPG